MLWGGKPKGTECVVRHRPERMLGSLRVDEPSDVRYYCFLVSSSLLTYKSPYMRYKGDDIYLASRSQLPDVQAHMKEAAALALRFDPVDYDLCEIVVSCL